MTIDSCSKSKRMLAFLIDRFILFSIWFFAMKYSIYFKYFQEFFESISNRDILLAFKWAILLPLLAYLYLLIIYFIYFVIIHYYTNSTLGKNLMNIELVTIKNEVITKCNFKDLLKRYLYLYLSGLGALGYLYPFNKSRESGYDKIINSYVINKHKY